MIGVMRSPQKLIYPVFSSAREKTLPRYPAEGITMTGSFSTASTGAAGEHIVCFDLRRQGFVAFLAPQDCHYDVVVDIGSRLLRVQVKTTVTPYTTNGSVTPSYTFDMRRARNGGRIPIYEDSDFDILALAALDIMKVGYMPAPVPLQGVTVRTASLDYHPKGDGPCRYIEDLTFLEALTQKESW